METGDVHDAVPLPYILFKSYYVVWKLEPDESAKSCGGMV